ncbi:GP2 glycosylated envelope protein [African pouched rat arterivirus]|uniref:GP2 glycosylated envelope protein n=1 Tax=African pouched rat arterivirus TaxID=1965064 RepID=A0A0B5JWP0_9NIDO|nr:GP2 glycosylated envelope protein [African pouched rat arterivirus]AJG06160.1 GP2 glycosylated envelope protein [African pouched rat arterivirus]
MYMMLLLSLSPRCLTLFCFLAFSSPSLSLQSWWGSSSFLFSARSSRVKGILGGRLHSQNLASMLKMCTPGMKYWSIHPLPLLFTSITEQVLNKWILRQMAFQGSLDGLSKLYTSAAKAGFQPHEHGCRYEVEKHNLPSTAKFEDMNYILPEDFLAKSAIVQMLKYYSTLEARACYHLMSRASAISALLDEESVNVTLLNNGSMIKVSNWYNISALHLHDLEAWVLTYQASIFSSCAAACTLYLVMILRTPLYRVFPFQRAIRAVFSFLLPSRLARRNTSGQPPVRKEPKLMVSTLKRRAASTFR